MKNKVIKMLIITILTFALILLAGCGKNDKNEENKQANKNANIQVSQNKTTNEDINQEQITTNAVIGTVVKSGNYTYFWKLDAGSRASTAIMASYQPTKSYKNKLVRLDSNGNEKIIIEEAAAGTICVTNERIFYESTAEDNNKIYSIDLDGNNKKEHVEGALKYVVGDYIYVQELLGTQGKNKIDVISIKTGDLKTVVDDGNLVGVADSHVYYTRSTYKNVAKLEIGHITNNEDKGIVASVSKSEYDGSEYLLNYSNVSFINFKYNNGKVKIAVGDIQGTGHFVQQGFVITMNADGTGVNKAQITQEDDIPDSVLGTNELVVNTSENGLVYTNPKTDETKMIITNNEISQKFGFKVGEEYTTSVYSADIMENELFITLDNGVHNSAEDMGWRYSYKREKTVVFVYNLENQSIKAIYEF